MTMPDSNRSLFDLTGRVALVAGGNGGLGLAMALGMSHAGADIAVAGRNDAKNAAAVAAIEAVAVGRRAVAIPADVTSASDIDDMVSRAVAHVHAQLPHPPGNQMRVLRSEINDYYSVRLGGVVHKASLQYPKLEIGKMRRPY